jgi:hypothetical protein
MRDYRTLLDNVTGQVLDLNTIGPFWPFLSRSLADGFKKRRFITYFFPDGVVRITQKFDHVYSTKPSGNDFDQWPWETVTGLKVVNPTSRIRDLRARQPLEPSGAVPQRSSLHRRWWLRLAGGDPGRRLSRELQLQLLDQQA